MAILTLSSKPVSTPISASLPPSPPPGPSIPISARSKRTMTQSSCAIPNVSCPKKRLFFREGEELLNMRDRLYYSRRFTNIETGAKVSGDYEGYKFAFFNIHGDTTHDDTRAMATTRSSAFSKMWVKNRRWDTILANRNSQTDIRVSPVWMANSF